MQTSYSGNGFTHTQAHIPWDAMNEELSNLCDLICEFKEKIWSSYREFKEKFCAPIKIRRHLNSWSLR